MRLFPALAALLALAGQAAANDTMAELAAGGLIFVRSDVVEIASEDLFISEREVRVDYVFRNRSDTDVESVVAFPMPDIEASPDSNVAVPEPAADNFLDFTVTAQGRAIDPELEQRAIAAGVDVTAELQVAGIPLQPYEEGVEPALARLDSLTVADWSARGIVTVQEWDEGDGMKAHVLPVWTLRSTYWWRMTFPAGEALSVSHRYRPSVGATVGLTFVEDGKVGGPRLAEYRRKYCVDQAFERAVQRAVDRAGDQPPLFEHWISYVLKTGANWAATIGEFSLTIDKGDPGNLVSFCGTGVRKTGPTTFELVYRDFYPSEDIHILLLKKP